MSPRRKKKTEIDIMVVFILFAFGLFLFAQVYSAAMNWYTVALTEPVIIPKVEISKVDDIQRCIDLYAKFKEGIECDVKAGQEYDLKKTLDFSKVKGVILHGEDNQTTKLRFKYDQPKVWALFSDATSTNDQISGFNLENMSTDELNTKYIQSI